MCGIAYLAAKISDIRLTLMIFCHLSVGVSIPPSIAMPGVGDEQVDPPEALDRGRDEARDVLFVADVGGDRTAPIGAASRSQVSWLRSDSTTWPPSFANRVHSARPIPLAPPVTTHTLSLTFMAGSFLRC